MASNIGLPSVIVEFKQKASTAIQRGNTGIVALVLRDSNAQGLHNIKGTYDIPSNLSEANKKYINLTLLGNVTAPSKVVAYVVGEETQLSDALNYLETVDFNYLVVPAIKENERTVVKTFIEKMRNDIKVRVKAVMKLDADYEGIVNSTNTATMVEGEINVDEFCCVMAGLIAGTPLSQSVTYAVPKNVLDIPSKTKAEAETKVKNGELILVKEMGKVRVARGVNSLKTTTTEKGDLFQKIKLVDTMDLIHNDIRKTCIDTYIGKVPNNYDNKCILMTAISSYFEELAKEQLIEKDFKVDIDIDKQVKYLKSIGVDTSEMDEQQIKEANTKDKVFLIANIKLVDAMEEISLEINL